MSSPVRADMMMPLQNWGASADEVAETLRGDDLIEGATSGTRSITVGAEPSLVFDLLSQMGFGRAGWYSYDWIDNLGRRSADDLHPEWMVTRPGEAVPGGPVDFAAETVDRPNTLVLYIADQALAGHQISFSLAYQLRCLDPPGLKPATRLVSRARVLVAGPLGQLLTPLLLFGDGVMVRRQLLGLKQRAEALASNG